jgi:hypothetical protein
MKDRPVTIIIKMKAEKINNFNSQYWAKTESHLDNFRRTSLLEKTLNQANLLIQYNQMELHSLSMFKECRMGPKISQTVFQWS